jgi:PAS domain S-box-containing protein
MELFPHPIWVADAAGAWRAFNRGWLEFTGRNSAQESQGGWLQGVHPEDLDRVRQAFQEGFQAQTPFRLGFRLKHADGSFHWVETHVSLLGGPNGSSGYLGSCYDLSAARLVEDRTLRLGQLYEALCRITRIAKFSPGTEVLFEASCRVVVEIGHFSLAWIGLLEPRTGEITPVAGHGSVPGLTSEELRAWLEETRLTSDPGMPSGRGLVGQACREAHFTLSNDIQSDPRMSPWLELASAWGIRGSAAFPLLVRGQVRGAVAIYATEAGAFDSEVVDLLNHVSEDISSAIERLEHTRRWSEVEGRLRASERLFSATLDTLSAAIAILDETGRILAVNAAWLDFQDAGNPLVHGLSQGDDYRAVCSSFLEQEGPLFTFVLGTLEVIEGVQDRFTAEYSSLGGAASRWYATTVQRFSFEGLNRTVVAHREVTDRKLVEDQLRHSELLFRMITENAQDLVALLDDEGRRLYAGPSHLTLLGYTMKDLLTQEPLEIISEPDRERMRGLIRSLVDGSLDATITEYHLVRKDGHRIPVESRLTAIREPLHGSTSILVVARDMGERLAAEQERRRMEAELSQAQKLESIGQLAAGIAHEINTPTQYIGDNLHFIATSLRELDDVFGLLMSLETADAEPVLTLEALRASVTAVDLGYLRGELPKATEQSLEGVARVSKIVNAMKEFSHPESEEKVMADLNRAIESTVAISRNEWKYVADLELDLDPGLQSVPCHPGAINQVVLNLIVNAAHAIGEVVGHSGDKGRITVRTRSEGPWAVIQVEDTGAGIPEAIQTRIFDPFFTTKGVGKGSGQGLAIARSVVVDKHGGTLGFDTQPGQGTLFTVRIPLDSGPPG